VSGLWPEWTARAACRGADLTAAFGTAEQQHAFIAAFCRDCPVKQECGEWGRDEFGVFGGLTQKTRSDRMGRTMRTGKTSRRPRPEGDPCGTHRGVRWHQRRGEEPCQGCVEARRAYDRDRYARRGAA
jgi:hypothetical protein